MRISGGKKSSSRTIWWGSRGSNLNPFYLLLDWQLHRIPCTSFHFGKIPRKTDIVCKITNVTASYRKLLTWLMQYAEGMRAYEEVWTFVCFCVLRGILEAQGLVKPSTFSPPVSILCLFSLLLSFSLSLSPLSLPFSPLPLSPPPPLSLSCRKVYLWKERMVPLHLSVKLPLTHLTGSSIFSFILISVSPALPSSRPFPSPPQLPPCLSCLVSIPPFLMLLYVSIHLHPFISLLLSSLSPVYLCISVLFKISLLFFISLFFSSNLFWFLSPSSTLFLSSFFTPHCFSLAMNKGSLLDSTAHKSKRDQINRPRCILGDNLILGWGFLAVNNTAVQQRRCFRCQ